MNSEFEERKHLYYLNNVLGNKNKNYPIQIENLKVFRNVVIMQDRIRYASRKMNTS